MSAPRHTEEPEEASARGAGAQDEYPDIVLDHNYDGIREYDNPMPGWWKWLFFLSVVWSAVYVAGIILGYVPDYGERLARGQAEIEDRRLAHAAEKTEVSPEMLAAAVQDEAALAEGEGIFKMSCANCHGKQGEGMIGPNLTDDYWIHGGSLMAMYTTVDEGVVEKGMPARGGAGISDEELVAVIAYMDTLRGTSPEGAKGPEGELYEPEQ